MRINIHRFLLAPALLLAGLGGTSGETWAQAAQSWPAKPIRLVVPLTPGSATDVMGRVVMDQVSAQVGQPIIVENRPGAGNTIGMGAVAKSDPDGYTLLANSSTHTVTPATRTNLGFEMTDLAAIAPLGNMPVVMVVNPSKGYKKLSDFVAAAKAKPGSVNYASAGAGNSSHLNGERFRLAAGFEAVHLPFKGAPEALTEVIAGRADFYFAPLVNALPLLKDGQLQALAVSGSSRASALPDVPTTVEAGYPNSEYNFWAGVFAPAKTPADIRAKLYAEIVKALNPIAAGGKSLSALAAAYAKQHIKNRPREAGGDNRGPWVRSYLDWDGKDARWFAGFVCFALEQAAHTLGVQLPIKSSSSCDVLAMEAKTAGKFVPESRVRSGAFAKKDLVPGTFFLVRKVPEDWVHVGIVTAPAKESFDTAEGNTDSGGSSNGFEAAERARGYASKDFIVW